MDLHVNRSDLHDLRIVDLEPRPLEPGQVRFAIERFGLSANNVTYAVIGDMLQYWAAFPAPQGWGRVPVWGFASVVASAHPDVEVGRRVFGFLPMSEDLVVTADRVDDRGLTDVSSHRSVLAATYNRYQSARADEAPGSAEEDRRMLLYGLFVTSFLVDDFLAEGSPERGPWFGATTLVISSASAKTALGIAYLASRRGGVRVVGLTSAANVDFVRERGVYDEVVAYDQIDSLPAAGAVYVDVSGSAAVRAAVHEHYGDDLFHDMILGGTHWDSMGDGGTGDTMPGPEPAFFFAPAQISKRSHEWGQAALDETIEAAWAGFSPWAGDWLTLHHGSGLDAVAATFLDLLDNRSDPTVGHLLSPRSPA